MREQGKEKGKKILVLNSGSSSLKFQLFAVPDLTVEASGLIEQIGDTESPARLTCFAASGEKKTFTRNDPVAEHRQAIMVMAEMLRESGAMTDAGELAGIGHRVCMAVNPFTCRFSLTIRLLVPLMS